MTHLNVPILKPRNPFALFTRQRQAGAHRRGTGGLRQRAERGLQRELCALHQQRHSP